jgi:hypothetical protein
LNQLGSVIVTHLSVQEWPAKPNPLRSETESLEDVGAATNTTVKENAKVGTV